MVDFKGQKVFVMAVMGLIIGAFFWEDRVGIDRRLISWNRNATRIELFSLNNLCTQIIKTCMRSLWKSLSSYHNY